MRAAMLVVAMLAAGPAVAQGLGLPGLGGGQGQGQGQAPGGGLGGAMGGMLGGGGAGGAAAALQGAFGQQTPEQRRAFCTRVAGAARGCGLTLDPTALGACLVRSLPAEDSARVARVANAARGNPIALLGECGIGG
ncbi:hypothetical protein [Falsiroseomonas sp. CW058]|uniref:hypothetical protein n=1 Tax=Falsiroseomonas sp. CW058 TaxID=3388664 RepID=UPI003D320983